jgi:hypothetical protein
MVTGTVIYPKNELISIPSSLPMFQQLKLELSTPKMIRTTEGKIGLDSKKEMRSRKVKSPNMFDSLVYAYADGKFVVDTLTCGSSIINCSDIISKDDFYDFVGTIYKNGQNIYILLLACNLKDGSVYIYREWEFTHFNSGFILEIKALGIFKVDWFCNEELMDEVLDSQECMYYKFTNNNITPICLPTYNLNYSLDNLISLFNSKKIKIHHSCDYVSSQLRSWTYKKGQPEKDLFACNCLVYAVSGLFDYVLRN